MAALAAAGLAALAGILPVTTVGVYAPLVKASLGLSDVALGSMVSAFFITGIAVVAVIAKVADRQGWRRLLGIGCSLSFVALAGLALAQAQIVLLGSMAIGGAGMALGVPGTNLAVISGTPDRRLSFALSAKQTAAPVASVLAGASLLFFARSEEGWRFAFLLLCLFPVLALTFTAYGRDNVRAPRRRLGVSRPERADLRYLILAGGLASFAVNALNAFFAISAVNAGLSPATAGGLVATGSGVGLAARLSVGWHFDRSRHDPITGVTALLIGGACGFAGLAMFESYGALVVVGVLTYGAGWGWPGLLQLVIVRRHPGSPGHASSLVQTGIFAGAALGPVSFGLYSALFGYSAAWWMVATIISLAAAAAARFHVRTSRRVNDNRGAPHTSI